MQLLRHITRDMDKNKKNSNSCQSSFAKTCFTLEKKNTLASGFCLWWERVRSAFIHGPNDSAVITGVWRR